MNAAEALAGVCRSAWRPSDRTPPDAWAEARVRITSARAGSGRTDAAEPGPLRLDLTPYWRQVLRAFADPAIVEMTAVAASQTGKSTVERALLLYALAQRRSSVLVVYPTRDDAAEVCRDSLLPSIESTCPELLTGRAHDVKRHQIALRGPSIHMAWAKSPRTAKRRAVAFVFADELSDWPLADDGELEILDDLRARSKTYPERKLVCVGVPAAAGRGLDALYLAGDRRAWWWPCPRCGDYFLAAWDDVRWEGGIRAAPESVRARAWIQCPRCEGVVSDADKGWCNAMGVWLRDGERAVRVRGKAGRDPLLETRTASGVVDESGGPALWRLDIGCGVGSGGGGDDEEAADRLGVRVEPPETGPLPPSRHASWRVGGLVSPFVTLGEVAHGFALAGFRPRASWVNNALGLGHEELGERVELGEIERLTERTGYRRGVAPAGVIAIVLAIDVQRDGAWVLARGYGEGGLDQWLVEATWVPRAMALRLADLDHVTGWAFARTDASAPPLPVAAVAIDAGKWTTHVHEFVRRARARGVPNCYPVHGAPGMDRTTPYRTSRVDAETRGGEGERGSRRKVALPESERLDRLMINADLWRDHVAARVAAEIHARIAGDEHVPQGRWWLPEDCPGEYARHMTSEHCVTDRRTGRRRWVPLPGRRDNHLWDCEVYAAALADMLRVRHLRPTAAPAAAPTPAATAPPTTRGWMGPRSGRWV